MEMIFGGVSPSGASVGMFTTVGLCAPIPFGSRDAEPEETLERAELVSVRDETIQGFCAEAGTADAEADDEAGPSGDGLAARGRPGIGAAILGAFVFPCANVGAVVVPGAALRYVNWIAPAELLPVWFVVSTDCGLADICGGALGNAFTGMGSGIGGSDTRNAKAGFDPAAGAFLVVPFAPGAFGGAVVVPVCGDKLEGTARAGVVN